MSDDPTAPPGPDPVPPAAPPPRISRPGGPAPLRPPPRKDAPAARPPSKVKAYLVIGIIVSSVVLVGLIGWRLYVKLTQKPAVVRNVKVEWENAWNRARNAKKEIFEQCQAKVWFKGEALIPEDLEKVKKSLGDLQKTAEDYHELMDLLRAQGKLNSQEANDMSGTQVLLKAWIWDANGVLDPANKPPKYGGLYIPMYQAEKKMDEATQRLKEIRDQTQEIMGRKNADEILAIIKEIRGLKERLAECRDEFLRLDEELLKGLTLPDLKEDQLPDLKILRDYTSLSVMAFKEAGQIRSQFPSEEDLKDPPKEEPKQEPKPEPKEGPKKEVPPKEEPPKEQKEEPKKEPPK